MLSPMLKLIQIFALVLSACSDASGHVKTSEHDADADADANVRTGDATTAPLDATSDATADPLDAQMAPDARGPPPDDAQAPDARIISATALRGIELVEVGPATTCIARTADTLCWGEVLGASPAHNDAAPSPLVGLSHVKSLSIGGRHACAVDDQLRCWGRGFYLGGVGATTVSPVVVASTSPRNVSVGNNHTCLQESTGNVNCWGDITIGLAGAQQFDSGYKHVCAVDSMGRATCWGDNAGGQCTGNTAEGAIASPRTLNIGQVRAVSAGSAHSCAVSSTGAVACWGDNAAGQLGHSPSETGIRAIVGLDRIVEVAAGSSLTCALDTLGAVFCWGDPYGFTPTKVIVSGAARVSVGEERACAVMTDTTAMCWTAGMPPVTLEK